jgi:hypothetical protein
MPCSAPGQAWLEIVQRPTEAAFAAAFAQNVVLDTSIAGGPITGARDVYRYFEASRGMYDVIRFTHETRAPSRTCLEWEGRFAGADIAGVTVLAFDPNGAIDRIRLYHRPLGPLIAYSVELGRRLAGRVGDATFLTAAPRNHETLLERTDHDDDCS